VLEKQAGKWSKRQHHEQAWALKQEEFESMLTEAGLGRIQCYGGYEPKPFDPETSPALILVARKAKE